MNGKLIALLGTHTPCVRLDFLNILVKSYPQYGGMVGVYRQGFRPLTTRHQPVDASDPAYASRRFFGSAEDAGLRFEVWADDALNLRHVGWYADDYGDETYRGAVFRLPAKRGCHERFVAGYGESMSEGFVLDLTEIWEGDFMGAAREADRLAESAAERERELQAREYARVRIQEIAAELKSIRGRMVRKACPVSGSHRAARMSIRQFLERLRRDRTALINERAKLFDMFPELEPARTALCSA